MASRNSRPGIDADCLEETLMFMVRFQVLKNSRVDAGAALEKTMHCLRMQSGKNAPCKPLRPCDGEHEERLRQEAQRLDSHAPVRQG